MASDSFHRNPQNRRPGGLLRRKPGSQAGAAAASVPVRTDECTLNILLGGLISTSARPFANFTARPSWTHSSISISLACLSTRTEVRQGVVSGGDEQEDERERQIRPDVGGGHERGGRGEVAEGRLGERHDRRTPGGPAGHGAEYEGYTCEDAGRPMGQSAAVRACGRFRQTSAPVADRPGPPGATVPRAEFTSGPPAPSQRGPA